MSEKLKDAVLTEAGNARKASEEVAKAGAYLYPFKGVFYFITHKDLWGPFMSRAGRTISLGMGITTFMFVFTYLPQMTIMAFTSGPLAAVSAALLVLSESSTITNLLSRSFLVEDALMDTFDGTLIARGQDSLVAEGRQVKSRSSGDAIARLGKVFTKPFSKLKPQAIVRSLILLPLNLIPVVGTLLYVALQGKRVGPSLHARYFQLKGWNGSQSDEWVKRNRGAYTGLGISAFALEMIPFASIAFSFTNTVGAALYAADLEDATK
ncbi:hypothetical protein N7509_013434 [Penicillium cosmopolitanum]|uniref:Outer spore wall protein RRT8 n=1 Tax=Penicillium cosmopolitanum TaxID=1131564 RepID=A0A9W9SDC6_9EURO|nr:uncharacterized protein N7509_013434 [Penicillium cosmopolitanum]KAJ5376548.1 hypothetical protein N7509_013434 [Penicillium cosmopolitanum]